MAEVIIKGRGDFERALRKFRTQCKREGIIKKFRERQHYTKLSQKRREKTKRKRISKRNGASRDYRTTKRNFSKFFN